MKKCDFRFVMVLVALMLIFALLSALPGCSGLSRGSGITIAGGEAIADAGVRIVARRIGSGFAKKNPDLCAPALVFCDLIVSGEVTEETVSTAQGYIEEHLADDPLLMADIQDLIGLVKTDSGGWDVNLVKAAADGFKQGVALCMKAAT